MPLMLVLSSKYFGLLPGLSSLHLLRLKPIPSAKVHNEEFSAANFLKGFILAVDLIREVVIILFEWPSKKDKVDSANGLLAYKIQ